MQTALSQVIIMQAHSIILVGAMKHERSIMRLCSVA